MSALSHAHLVVEHLSQKVSIEQLEDIREKIEDQNQDVEERNQFFIEAGRNAGGMQEEDLLDELNELEAEVAQQEFDVVQVSKIKVTTFKEGVPSQEPQVSIEDELAELEKLMA